MAFWRQTAPWSQVELTYLKWKGSRMVPILRRVILICHMQTTNCLHAQSVTGLYLDRDDVLETIGEAEKAHSNAIL